MKNEPVNNEMTAKEYISGVVNSIYEELKTEGLEPKLMMDQAVDLSFYAPHCRGYTDAIIVADGQVIVVLAFSDYPHPNLEEQTHELMTLGLGALELAEEMTDVKTVHLVSINLSSHSESRVSVSPRELYRWYADNIYDNYIWRCLYEKFI